MRAPLCSPDPSEALSSAVIDSPHPFYARLREEHPLSRIGETGVHLVASWSLVEEALARESDFSANLTGVLIRAADGTPARFEFPSTGATDVIATADDPQHALHRGLVQPRMTPARIAQLEPSLRRWTRDALGPWLAAGGGDYAPLSELVPALALANLLGLPEKDVRFFRTWAMMGGDMLAGDATAERLGVLGEETARMAAYLADHLERAIEDPQQGDGAPLLHALARGVLTGEIERQTAVGIAIVMFGAGGESTAALIGSCVRSLAEQPALAEELRSNPRLIPRFVEEIVRLEPPFKFHYRSVARACGLGGFQLEQGDRLMLIWASANRDPQIFDDPDSLRLDRRFPKKHMGFGRGSHFCVGATLARLEAQVMLEALLAGTRRFGLDPQSRPVYASSIFVRRLERLPISADAPAARSSGAT